MSIDLGFSSRYNIGSLSYPIDYRGETFYPEIGLTSFGPPRVTTTVDREIYEISMIDHADELQAQVRNNNVIGNRVTVYAGFFDEEDQPILSAEDVLVAYEGQIDSVAIINNYESKLIRIQAASPMADLDAVGGYIVSKEGMDQVSKTDTSFDQVYRGQKATTFRWGKS